MDEKASFIFEWESGESTVSALCESFGISRTLAYRYIGRYLDHGRAGLIEQSRAPRRVWNRTAEDLERAVIELRRRKPRLGALKLHELLREPVCVNIDVASFSKFFEQPTRPFSLC